MAVNPARFIQEVRREASKIHWPTRKETMLTTLMVFIMATVAAMFFFFVDFILDSGLRFLIDTFLQTRP